MAGHNVVVEVVTELLTDVLYLTRADWGADQSLPRKGYTTDRNGRATDLLKTEVDRHPSTAATNARRFAASNESYKKGGDA